MSVSDRTKHIVFIAEFSTLVAASSVFVIPVGPVPITLQTMMIALTGLCLGSRRGMLAITLYILAGCIGLPVFAGGKAGLGVLFGPTGGYLVGFVLMAGICGRASRESSLPRQILWVTLGLLSSYTAGIAGMMLTLDQTLMQAFLINLTFIPGGIIKMTAALTVWTMFRHRRKA